MAELIAANQIDIIEVEDKHYQQLLEVLGKFLPYRKVLAYGSRVKATHSHTSDLDLVAFDSSDTEIYAAQEAFDESEIPFMVQLLNWNTIPDDFKENVARLYHVVQDERSWRVCRLGDVCAITRGGSPRPIQDYIATTGTPWVKIADATINSSRFIYQTKEHIKIEGEKKSRVVYPGDFIVSNSATPRLPRFMKIRACIHDGWLLLREMQNVQALFFYYLIIYERPSLLAKGNGSIFTNLKTDILKNHIASFPPLPEQQAIAEVLSSLDDKILNLQQQNTKLEAMAETLFRQWFIEEAQDDWIEKPLDEIAYYLNGLACQKYRPKNEIDKLPVLKIKELNNGITDNSDWATTEVDSKYIVNLGDVIFSWSGSLALKLWDGEQCVLNQHLFKVTSQQYPKWFFYYWTKHHLDKFISIAESKATTMGHIKRGHLSESITLVPSEAEIESMNDIMQPQMSKIESNLKQIRVLEALRETLLPKLISGDVRVKYNQKT